MGKIPQSKEEYENYVSKTEYLSCLLIDMLTIALGPEHHDIVLIDCRNV
jgi:hypothetical protein